MAQRKRTQGNSGERDPANAFAGGLAVPPFLNNPLLSILGEMNGSFLESAATAQKDWMDFVHRRIKEDVAIYRQLMRSQSLPEMYEVFGKYFRTALEQYQEQTEKVVHRGESVAQHMAEASEAAVKEAARARH